MSTLNASELTVRAAAFKLRPSLRRAACRRCASITPRVWVSRCSCSSVSHEIQQVGVTGELDQIRMGDGQGLAPVDERVVRGEEIDDVSAFLVGHGASLGGWLAQRCESGLYRPGEGSWPLRKLRALYATIPAVSRRT